MTPPRDFYSDAFDYNTVDPEIASFREGFGDMNEVVRQSEPELVQANRFGGLGGI